MRLSATYRRRIRQLAGAVLVSLGTAVFTGSVQLVVDALARNTTVGWHYLVVFVLLGTALSSSGGWLLTSLRDAAGLSVLATEPDTSTDQYLDQAEAFARFGSSVFTNQTSVHVPVLTAADIGPLRTRLDASIRALAQASQRNTTIGLYFYGRHHVGFQVGQWLNVAGRRIHLYSDARGDANESHFLAIRLRPAIKTAPRPLELAFYRPDEAAPQRITLGELPGLLDDENGCVGLGINLVSALEDKTFIRPVLRSAYREGALGVVIAALPAPRGDTDGIGRELRSTLAELESTTAALVAVCHAIPAKHGLLYFKTPAVISVALGRYLRQLNWIAMQHTAKQDTYARFSIEPREHTQH